MKAIAYLCLLLWSGSNNLDIGEIAKINKLKAEAEAAYKNKQYNVAIKRYEELIKLGVSEEAVLLNLAHSYFGSQDTTKAKDFYGKLIISKDKYMKSVANQQIGVIKANNKNYQESLLSFKESLRAMPENEEARHNYELVKKLLEQQKKQQQQQQQKQDKNENKDKQKENKEKEEQQNKEQQQKEQQQKQDQEGDKKDKADKKEQEGKDDKKEKEKQGKKDDQSDKKGKEEDKETNEKRSQRLEKMNLTEDQAKTILDAMKSNEVQYLQQNKKKPTKKADKSKPDW